MKRCFRCKEEKDIIEFNKDKTKASGVRFECRVCRRGRQQAWVKNLTCEQRKEYYWRKDLKSLYNIYPEDYNNLVIKQNNVCAICGEKEKIKRIKRLSVDHCHETGKVRGLLCNKCNTGLGKFNNPEILLRAIKYLENLST